jgi:elongation factor 1-beta
MGSAAVKLKIMPDSPDADLEEIERKAEEIILKEQGRNINIQREPIAFGLNAIIISFAWQEDLEREILEQKLSKIPHVNSAEVVDFRRAFG